MAGWAVAAAEAERAICARHLRRLLLPGTRLGLVGWPPTASERFFLRWNYWWQTHLLDCLIDAQGRASDDRRRADIIALIRGIQLRNGGQWLNDYYDDIAWFGLALERAELHAGVEQPAALEQIAARLRDGWTEHGGGGIWWRRRDDFKNVPANGPAAILFARLSERGDRADLQRARSIVDWIREKLIDPVTGVVYDGLHVNADGSVREVDQAVYTYCHGAFIGACTELAEIDGAAVWARLAADTIGVVGRRMATPTDRGPVISGQGGGDGGLFGGILARYLAQAALVLDDSNAVTSAAELVYASAASAWTNRTEDAHGPVFGAEWTLPEPARDLSVQVSAWMLFEAAALLEDADVPDPGRNASVSLQ